MIYVEISIKVLFYYLYSFASHRKVSFSYVKQVIHVIAIVESNPCIFTYSMHYNVSGVFLQARSGSTVY